MIIHFLIILILYILYYKIIFYNIANKYIYIYIYILNVIYTGCVKTTHSKLKFVCFRFFFIFSSTFEYH